MAGPTLPLRNHAIARLVFAGDLHASLFDECTQQCIQRLMGWKLYLVIWSEVEGTYGDLQGNFERVSDKFLSYRFTGFLIWGFGMR